MGTVRAIFMVFHGFEIFMENISHSMILSTKEIQTLLPFPTTYILNISATSFPNTSCIAHVGRNPFN